MLDAVMHKNKRKQHSELPIFEMNRKSPKYQKAVDWQELLEEMRPVHKVVINYCFAT